LVFDQWDYAAVDMSGCPTLNVGWYGTGGMSDSQLYAAQGKRRGYPDRAPCPAGAHGDYDDCPGTGLYPGSTWRHSDDVTRPYDGAQIWYTSSYDINPGKLYSANTIKTSLDTTFGDSGSALYVDPVST